MAYQPRLNSTGMQMSRYWYSPMNPFFVAGYGLPNCTCYAFGRFWEINNYYGHGNTAPRLPTGNAEEWFDAATNYDRGQSPKLGAIICFANPQWQGVGHVGVVEEIHANGEIVTSNSAWQGQYFFLETLQPDGNGKYHWAGGGGVQYISLGFIYNPYVEGGSPTPPPTAERDNFPWVLYANRLRQNRIR